jgi:hypothetical protein
MDNEQVDRVFSRLKEQKTGFSFLDMDFPAEYFMK